MVQLMAETCQITTMHWVMPAAVLLPMHFCAIVKGWRVYLPAHVTALGALAPRCTLHSAPCSVFSLQCGSRKPGPVEARGRRLVYFFCDGALATSRPTNGVVYIEGVAVCLVRAWPLQPAGSRQRRL